MHKKKKKLSNKRLKNYLDAIWSRLTKRVGPKYCQWCGNRENLQSDHIFTRHKHGTRWDLRNCVILCLKCHIFRKKTDPLGWGEMVKAQKGQTLLDALKLKSEMVKIDKERVMEELERVERDLEYKEPILGQRQ